jgi:hypothetical protein
VLLGKTADFDTVEDVIPKAGSASGRGRRTFVCRKFRVYRFKLPQPIRFSVPEKLNSAYEVSLNLTFGVIQLFWYIGRGSCNEMRAADWDTPFRHLE